MSYKMLTLEYGNATTDRHRRKVLYQTEGFVAALPSEPTDYAAPTGEPPVTIDVLSFVAWWWQNQRGFLNTAYSLYRAYQQDFDEDTGLVSIATEEISLGVGWGGTLALDPRTRQPGGYHCYTLRDSAGRNLRFFLFGSNAATGAVHTLDAFHTTREYNILKGLGAVSSWKPVSAGTDPSHGLHSFVGVSPFMTCGINKRNRKHNIY